jgi:glutamyl-tRNA synthetase
MDDFVLFKSDGYPTYHLASVVDDHMMEISHVLRAEEWLPSTPRHLMLYQTLGFEPPQFAHLPMLLGADRAKLSKRHGAVAITEYREHGYLPEAMMNSLALLGWSLDDKTELMSREKLIDNFSLERVSRTAAIFNKDKLEWMNGVYIRRLNLEDFTQQALPFLDRGLPSEVKRPLPTNYISQVMSLVQERAKTLAEVSELTQFFFVTKLSYESRLLIVKKMNHELAIKALETSLKRLEELPVSDEESLETTIRPLAEELGLKTAQLFGTLRVAVTGRTVAPPLFQTMSVLGKEYCLKRVREAITSLRQMEK